MTIDKHLIVLLLEYLAGGLASMIVFFWGLAWIIERIAPDHDDEEED